MYKKVSGTEIIYRLKDGGFIPLDPENRDYQQYLLFISKGGKIKEYDPITVDKNKEIDNFFSSSVFASIIESLADLAKVDITELQDKAKEILNKKVE